MQTPILRTSPAHVDTIFPSDDSIKVIKGIQMEAEVTDIETDSDLANNRQFM
ncbi:MAG: hypothetical protein Q7J85_09695 [Bacillota bacterium]|nr:hypothetical protein [Bacillota bacterium]